MGSLIVGLVQCSSIIVKFLFLEERLGTRRKGRRERRENLHSISGFF